MFCGCALYASKNLTFEKQFRRQKIEKSKQHFLLQVESILSQQFLSKSINVIKKHCLNGYLSGGIVLPIYFDFSAKNNYYLF